MREKYRFHTGNPLSPRETAFGRIFILVGSEISQSIGGRVDVFYDRKTRVLSISRGDLLNLTLRSEKSVSSSFPAGGLRRFFNITFRGRLEADWNEKEGSWDVVIPENGEERE